MGVAGVRSAEPVHATLKAASVGGLTAQTKGTVSGQGTSSPARQSPLMLSGVKVSVRADLLVHGSTKREQQIGAAVLRMTQDDAETESAKTRRHDMGLYVATLARLHMDQNIPTNRSVANRLCMSIDIQHGDHFQAPDSNTRRMSDLENACRFIAAMWPQI
jgi:hypothetical protein